MSKLNTRFEFHDIVIRKIMKNIYSEIKLMLQVFLQSVSSKLKYDLDKYSQLKLQYTE